MSEDLETCRVIIDHGPHDFAAVNNAGNTAMDLAVGRGDDDIIAALIAVGAPRQEATEASVSMPLVSEDARFLIFTEIPEPDEWLRGQIAGGQKAIRIAADRLSLRWASMAFWPGGYLLAMRNLRRLGLSERFALVWPGQDFILLDWTNQPIYAAAERHEPLFDDVNAMAWCRFFFHFVRGNLGRFRITERVEEIVWTDVADEAAHEAVAPLLEPLHVVERPAEDRLILAATVVFKNALFRTKILLATRATEIEEEGSDGMEKFARGQSRLFGEELLLEDLPFHVDGPPTRYG